MTFDQKLENYKTTLKKLKSELSEGLKTAMKEKLAEFPDVASVRWEAYTPYFNDGEPCVYGVSAVRVAFKNPPPVKDEPEYGDKHFSSWDFDYKWSSGWGSKKIYDEAHKPFAEVHEAVEKWITGIPLDVMLDCFDDHKRITVTPDKVIVEDFDHD